MLLADIAGTDRYEAGGAELESMVDLLVGVQRTWSGRADELLGIGVPDWRVDAFVPRAQALLDRARSGAAGPLTADEIRRLDVLVGSLPQRNAALANCGVPDGLFHGDFHPGNVRGTPQDLRVLDWGDAGIGHPLLDEAAFCQRLTDADRSGCCAGGSGCGRPRSQAASRRAPAGCCSRCPPFGARWSTSTSWTISIEPDERPYHATDPYTWLQRAALLAAPSGRPD